MIWGFYDIKALWMREHLKWDFKEGWDFGGRIGGGRYSISAKGKRDRAEHEEDQRDLVQEDCVEWGPRQVEGSEHRVIVGLWVAVPLELTVKTMLKRETGRQCIRMWKKKFESEDNKEELLPGEEVGWRDVFLNEKLSGAVFRLRKGRNWNEKEKWQ